MNIQNTMIKALRNYIESLRKERQQLIQVVGDVDVAMELTKYDDLSLEIEEVENLIEIIEASEISPIK